MEINTVTMVWVGIGIWVAGLAVVLVLTALGAEISPVPLRVCFAGIGLGAVALGWAIPRERRRRATTTRSTHETPAS